MWHQFKNKTYLDTFFFKKNITNIQIKSNLLKHYLYVRNVKSWHRGLMGQSAALYKQLHGYGLLEYYLCTYTHTYTQKRTHRITNRLLVSLLSYGYLEIIWTSSTHRRYWQLLLFNTPILTLHVLLWHQLCSDLLYNMRRTSKCYDYVAEDIFPKAKLQMYILL